MKFKFSFETLLTHRKRIEEEAQRQYFEANRRVDEVLDLINHMYRQVDQTREDIQAFQAGGDRQIDSIQTCEDFITGLKLKIEIERKRVRALMVEAEEKHQALLEAAREFKSIEKIKEKKHKEFKARRKKLELKEIDEMVTMRHKRGSVA